MKPITRTLGQASVVLTGTLALAATLTARTGSQVCDPASESDTVVTTVVVDAAQDSVTVGAGPSGLWAHTPAAALTGSGIAAVAVASGSPRQRRGPAPEHR